MPEALQTTLPDQEVQEPESRRDMIASLLTQAEEVNPAEQSAEQRARDEAGRFAKPEVQDVQAKTEPAQGEIPAAPAPQERKLTTWKKDYTPIQQKLERGEALTPEESKKLAEYNYQRESEYSTGVSVHKDRATRLESVEKAMAPFMPELQKNNIAPDVWIGNLGRAHHTLALGTPEQKLQMFQKLAQDYGIPLGAVQQQANGQQLDPVMLQMMEHVNRLEGELKGFTGKVTSWEEKQEQASINSMLAKFENAEKYPHYAKVRVRMGQLLGAEITHDLDEAYDMAVRTDKDVWQEDQARQSQAAAAQNTQRQVVAKAKANAISVRSSTPSGSTGDSTAKDRRAMIAEAFDAHAGGRV